MSKILDAITNAVTDNKPITVKKPAKKTANKLEAVTAKVLSPELESLVQSDFKASKMVVKVEGAEYATFKALVLECQKAGVFQDSKLLKLVQTRIAVVFNSDTITARRNTMLSNTAKVAYGGTVGRESDGSKRTIAGLGWGAVLEVLTKATSIRTYHPLITAAKPEGLKSKPKSDVEIAQAKEALKRKEEAKATKEAAKHSKTITPEQVSKAVFELLHDYASILLPGSDARELELINELEQCIVRRLEGIKKAV